MANINGTAGADQIRPTGVSAGVSGGTPSNAADAITGRAGDDTINAGGGNDTVEGGQGADNQNGAAGRDLLSYATAATGVEVFLRGFNDTGGDSFGDNNRGFEDLLGSRFNDRLNGDTKSNTIDGGRGDDVLDGAQGSDLLLGGDGDDTLEGGVGRDTLDGGTSGFNDVFRFNAANLGADLIRNFDAGKDRILFNADNISGFGTGPLNPSQFAAGGTPSAGTNQPAILYDTDNGKLFLDTNGALAGGRILIATIDGAPTLVASDIFFDFF